MSFRALARRTMSSLPSTMRAVQIQEQGGIDKLQMANVPLPVIGEDQVLIKNEWAGINFIDTYQRGGLYKLPQLPAILGNECAGTIVKLGSKVDPAVYGYKEGDRVVSYTNMSSYAEYAVGPAYRTGKLPDGLSTKVAAASVVQGLTALTNIREAHHVNMGESVLVHAAAGGLGLLLCQMCKAVGAHVIGTTSTQEKAARAKKNGADDVVLYGGVSMDEVVKQIKALTPGGEGVHAVFDGVGKDTFEADLELLRRKGTLVSIGNASGAVPPFAPLRLGAKNIKLLRPVLTNSVFTREEFQPYWSELSQMILDKKVDVALYKEDGYEFSTEGVQQAHKDISARSTTGKLLLKIS